MTPRETAPPAAPPGGLPRNSIGKILWSRMPAFVAWLNAEASHLTNLELANAIRRRYHVPFKQSTADRLRHVYHLPQSSETRQRAYTHRDAPIPDLVRPLGPQDEAFFVRVEGDCFVTSDWHIPHQKEALFGHLLDMAQAWRVKTLIINGDFLNEDAFSVHRQHRFQTQWPAEKMAARAILERLFDVFEEIVYILDNHDRRLLAAMEDKFRGRLDESDVLDLLTHGVRVKKLRPSIDYRYVLVNGEVLPPLKPWRITSPKEYRRIKLSLPHRLAQVYHQNIIIGGDHLFGMGLDDSTAFAIANSMCMVDPERVPYINVQDSTFPHWNPGFYLLRANRLLAFPDHPAFTDWAEAKEIGRLLMSRPKRR